MYIVAPHSFLSLEAAAPSETHLPQARALATVLLLLACVCFGALLGCSAGALDILQDRVGRQAEIKDLIMFPGKFSTEFH